MREPELLLRFMLVFPINGAEQSASGAAFLCSRWLIPMFRADFPHGPSKIVEVEPYLPVNKQDFLTVCHNGPYALRIMKVVPC